MNCKLKRLKIIYKLNCFYKNVAISKGYCHQQSYKSMIYADLFVYSYKNVYVNVLINMF